MFLCACCNYLGQWDKLSNFIASKKSKNDTEKSDIRNSTNAVKTVLEKIRETTYHLKTLPESTFHDILKDFTLPVSICFKYLALANLFFY